MRGDRMKLKVRYFCELLQMEVVKEFDSLKKACDFAYKVRGVLIG